MGLDTIDISSKTFKISCQKTIKVVALISFEILSNFEFKWGNYENSYKALVDSKLEPIRIYEFGKDLICSLCRLSSYFIKSKIFPFSNFFNN